MTEPQENGGAPAVECSVLVPVLNEERHIRGTVAAMQRQRFDGEIEFLLVDGQSTDGTLALLQDLAREDPRIRVLLNPRRGTPSGLNLGLAHARGRWVARMDGHTEYPDDYLSLGVQRLLAGGTRWVSGPQVPRGENLVSRAVALALTTTLGRGASRKWGTDAGPGEEYELDSGVFAGVWERSTLLEYGGWDEGWLRNQDSELAGRFLARGERLICVPAMGAFYLPRGRLRGLWRQYLQYGEYRCKTAVRHPATLRRSHLLAPGVVAAAVASGLAPSPLRRWARHALLVYTAVIGSAGVSALRAAEDRREAALVPVVLVLMHFGHGTGMVRGALRGDLPAAALASALGMRHLAERLWPPPPVVEAPSLHEQVSGSA